MTAIGTYVRQIDDLDCIHPASRSRYDEHGRLVEHHATIDEAVAERWGSGCVVGYPYARGMAGLPAVLTSYEWCLVGYVAAHTSGPACPVYRRVAASRHPLDIIRDRIPDATDDETTAEAISRVVAQRDALREQVHRLNADALRRDGCCCCGDYAAVTGMLHPDCPRHGQPTTCFVAPDRRALMPGLSEAEILERDHSYGECDSPDCPHMPEPETT